MSDIFNMISNAEYLKENDYNIFEELYVIQNIEKHDSGYHFIEIYGKKKNEEKLYI